MIRDVAVKRHKKEKIKPKNINISGNNKQSNMNNIVSVPSINPAVYRKPFEISSSKLSLF